MKYSAWIPRKEHMQPIIIYSAAEMKTLTEPRGNTGCSVSDPQPEGQQETLHV